MAEPTTSELKRRRRQLLRNLPSLEEVLRGSLVERYLRCGNPNCKCANGPGHGPKYYLSVSYPGRSPRMDYIRQAEFERVSEHLANYTQIREILEQVSEINHELLRRRESL